MCVLRPVQAVPSHLELTHFLRSLLPPHPRDVAPVYHTPRHSNYDAAGVYVYDVVLSITPTPGVYRKLLDLASSAWPHKPTCFLHRPFDLQRRALPHGSLVHANHKRFDELLTVGWNVPLATRLGLDTDTAVCIQGYKGDPDRRIGLVARLRRGEPRTLNDLRDDVVAEFGVGDIHPEQLRDDSCDAQIEAVAIMNAFGPDEVARAVQSAIKAGFIAEEQGHTKLLYLTGEPKEMGLEALGDTYNGMGAVCVGHRAAEEWGIGFLAACIKQNWTDVNVHVVLEEEVVEPPKKQDKPDTASNMRISSGGPG